MANTAQTRLDKETREVLHSLNRRGLKTSEVLRKGIHLVAREVDSAPAIQIIGLGKYDSGISDLGSNKKHLQGLGRSSMPGGKPIRRTKRS